MCGIIGLINGDKSPYKAADIFQELLYVDALRGEDSTGVFRVSRTGRSVDIRKRAVNAAEFLDSKKSFNFVNNLGGYKFVIGHNRKATMGSVNNSTAHPFKYKHITMVHNGTITNKDELANGCDVDSLAICKSLADRGTDVTLKEIDGAYALIWYDAQLDSLFVTRNDQRPLHMAKLKNSDSIMIASEAAMLDLVANRNHVQIHEPQMIKVETLYEFNSTKTKPHVSTYFNEGTPYWKKPSYSPASNHGWHGYNAGGSQSPSYTSGFQYVSIQAVVWEPHPNNEHMGDMYCSSTWKNYEDADIVVKGVPKNLMLPSKEYRGRIVTLSNIGGQCKLELLWTDVSCTNRTIPVNEQFSRDEVYESIPSLKEEPKEEPDNIEEEEANAQYTQFTEADTLPMYQGPGLNLITRDAFDTFTKHGCSNCGCSLPHNESTNVRWDDYNNPFCSDCAELSHVKIRNLH